MIPAAVQERAMRVFTSGGYFEKGRWITPHSLVMERMGDPAQAPQKMFELITHDAVPIFQRGKCVGFWDKRTSMGIFTQTQIKEILPSNELNTELMNRTEIVPVA
jgi:hypothetical protein